MKGDTFSGDKIITTIYQTLSSSLRLIEATDRRNLEILLGKVKQFWIEGILEKSIHTTSSYQYLEQLII